MIAVGKFYGERDKMAEKKKERKRKQNWSNGNDIEARYHPEKISRSGRYANIPLARAYAVKSASQKNRDKKYSVVDIGSQRVYIKIISRFTSRIIKRPCPVAVLPKDRTVL